MIGLFLFSILVAVIEFLCLIDLEPKQPIPLWSIIVAIVILCIPVINLAAVVVFGGGLIVACSNGFSLKGSNPVSKFFKSLNRTI